MPDGGELAVLDGIDLALAAQEIVALVGRSGAGKSTLLRIIAGSVRPTSGDVLYHGRRVVGPTDSIAMVFQSFALFPWLTVLDNVALGLEAQGLAADELQRRALEAIDLIGLDGFESAYPRELSGGMRQRVGFARALVVNPDLLLMDEPFSALDVLTAETLRTDFLDLWIERKISASAVLMVTHNIEEAVLLCDRIIVLSSHPGRVVAEIPVVLKHPRDRLDPDFQDLVDRIYASMTPRTLPAVAGRGGIAERLPPVSINRIAGLLETLASPAYGGRAELSGLAASLRLGVRELFPVADSLQLLGFAEVTDGTIHLTAAGRLFVDADTQVRKTIFAQHLTRNVPLASHIRRVLHERPEHRVERQAFLDELKQYFTEADAEAVLEVATNWGRYAEIYEYDGVSATFSLEIAAPPTAPAPEQSVAKDGPRGRSSQRPSRSGTPGP